MALNKAVFRTRAITAVVFAIVMLVGLMWNQWSFLLLFTIIHFGCWWEYLKLVERIFSVKLHIYCKLGLMLMGYGWMTWLSTFALFSFYSFSYHGYLLGENLSLPFTLAGFVLLIAGVFKQRLISGRAFAFAGLGLLYISISWGLMLELYQMNIFGTYNEVLPIVVIASIWINDTMAYVVGSFVGKTPLSKISPKKTWEGTIGGIILSVLLIGFLLPVVINLLPYRGIYFAIPLVAAITGTFGDLFESKLKRLAGVKDSGSFMPGHGGFMDRFDSLLLAIPCVWVLLIVQYSKHTS